LTRRRDHKQDVRGRATVIISEMVDHNRTLITLSINLFPSYLPVVQNRMLAPLRNHSSAYLEVSGAPLINNINNLLSADC